MSRQDFSLKYSGLHKYITFYRVLKIGTLNYTNQLINILGNPAMTFLNIGLMTCFKGKSEEEREIFLDF